MNAFQLSKAFVKRLRHDFIFPHGMRIFLFRLYSEASFSRFTKNISESRELNTFLQAIQEGFICDGGIAIDTTHFESRDQVTPQEKKPKTEPKKFGRKFKEE
ncbi:hypothetical protein [Lysinibacillus sphaericus]|uniref:hypothetical protein n=1 Tax=Lysinibacillus sphaericus TaxID=1421 RepID=UPI00191078CD|nr:hypothetical protein [Lysinibacillus sphaericus]QPA52734.1 hypothetical protein INQ53_12490 [Lysinibacillus sphaericus]